VPFRSQNRIAMAFLATVLAVVLLAACSTESDPATASPDSAAATTVPPTATPTPPPTPTPTPIPYEVAYEDFANAAVPSADPEQLARFTKLLSLIPESFNSVMYLDTEFLRSSDTLASLISPEELGLSVALPSLATGLVNTIAVAVDLETRELVTPFQSNLSISEMLRLASGFGLRLGETAHRPMRAMTFGR